MESIIKKREFEVEQRKLNLPSILDYNQFGSLDQPIAEEAPRKLNIFYKSQHDQVRFMNYTQQMNEMASLDQIAEPTRFSPTMNLSKSYNLNAAN